MISLKTSAFYTSQAIASFFTKTSLSQTDRFILIANDHSASELHFDHPIEVVENPRPMGFSQNVNVILREALAYNDDVCMLNNDIIFTNDWLQPLIGDPDSIMLPMCNQIVQYDRDDLKLTFSMDWEQFGVRFDTLDEIVCFHRKQHSDSLRRRDLVMPFYCFFLPHKILRRVGLFDEEFGQGGGEDIDYRLRALLAGYDVAYAAQSYVLHFMGKSTWRSGESKADTAARDHVYRTHFEAKWGPKAVSIFLSFWRGYQNIADLGLSSDLEHGDFAALAMKSLDCERLFRFAEEHEKEGKFGLASRIYGECIRSAVTSEEAWWARWGLGRCRRELGDAETFVKEVLAAYNSKPDHAGPLNELAEFYHKNAMFEVSKLFLGHRPIAAPAETEVLQTQEATCPPLQHSRDQSRSLDTIRTGGDIEPGELTQQEPFLDRSTVTPKTDRSVEQVLHDGELSMDMDLIGAFCHRWGANEVLMRSPEHWGDLRFLITGGEGRNAAEYTGDVQALRISYRGQFGNYFLQLVNLFHVAEALGVSKVYIRSTEMFLLDNPKDLHGIIAYPQDHAPDPGDYCLEGVFFNPDALGPIMTGLTAVRRQALAVKYLHPMMEHLLVRDERIGPDDLVIHMRAGNIFEDMPPATHIYVQPPLGFYLKVIADASHSAIGTIHVIAENGSNPVLFPLVQRITDAKRPVTLRLNQDLHSDLRILLSARRIVLANSTIGVAVMIGSNAVEEAFLFRNDGTGTLVPMVEYVGDRVRMRCYFETGVEYISSWGWQKTPEQVEAMLTLPAENIVEAPADGATRGFGEQELYLSLYRAAERKSILGYPVTDVIEAFLSAADAAPSRAEPLHIASRLCRYNSMFEKGYEIGQRAIGLTPPSGALFVESWVYEYGTLDEFAVNAYWAGHYHECLDACLKILERNTIPTDQRGRIVANAKAARDRL